MGPRPMILAEYDQIQARDRYGANDIRSGLTGWAQVNGRDGVTVEQKARLDGEKRHVQVAAGPPFAVGDVLQAGGHQHQGGLSVGERASDAGPSPDLPVQALDRVVRADAPPMLAGHLAVRGRLGEAFAHRLGGLLELHRFQVAGHGLGLGCRGLARFHRVDGLTRRSARQALEAHG